MKSLKFFVSFTMILIPFASQGFEWSTFNYLGGVQKAHDYAPSWMADTVSGYDRVWYCGSAHRANPKKKPGDPSVAGDTIWYSYTIKGQWQHAKPVEMNPSEQPWEKRPGEKEIDKRSTCEPIVVRGIFQPPGMGETYSMAMYFIGNNNPVDGDNHIGVAFSNDGTRWTKYPNNPVIYPMVLSGDYGAGCPNVRNDNGRAGITMWYVDVSQALNSYPFFNGEFRFMPGPAIGPSLFEVKSNDGVTFSDPKRLSTRGLAQYISTSCPAISLSPSPPYYLYGLFSEYSSGNEGAKIRMYRILYNERFSGKWEYLDEIKHSDINVGAIFEPGFRTDIYGNLSSSFPTIWAGFGCGSHYARYDHSGSETWDLCNAGGR